MSTLPSSVRKAPADFFAGTATERGGGRKPSPFLLCKKKKNVSISSPRGEEESSSLSLRGKSRPRPQCIISTPTRLMPGWEGGSTPSSS